MERIKLINHPNPAKAVSLTAKKMGIGYWELKEKLNPSTVLRLPR